ncbi:MAG: SDR family NAD(P)-dependent oxidoreductase, partial [Maritimibacter sp.]|nr:SDR family NAD(P)-dependent oxidoreductase [Maritimibacter sp.]
MDLRFDDKTVIVTGGASGIGAAVVDDLAASGATVIVADLTQDDSDA